MREILFRGKRKDNGEWIEGAFCGKNCDSFFGPMVDMPSIIKLDYPYPGYWFEVIGDTVGQYTGLTDKNGKKIFEGDIITADALFANRKVEFVDNTYWSAFCLVAANDDCDYMNEYSGIEVIGNIHDNPELLGAAYE